MERRDLNPQGQAIRGMGGISLGTSLYRMAEVLQEIQSFEAGTTQRARERMVKHLQSTKKQPGDSPQEVKTWGKGAMVFCNIMCDRNGVLTGRYLPLLGSPAPPIDTSRSLMWHALEKKNEKISPQMSTDYRKAMHRMWNACLNHPKAKTRNTK